MAFVDEVLCSKTCELVSFAQLQDSVDGRANRLKTLFASGFNRLPRQDSLYVDLDQHAVRAGLCRQLVRNFYRDFHFDTLYARWTGFPSSRR